MKSYLPILALSAAALLGGPDVAQATTITLTGLGFYQTIPLIVNVTTAENATAGQIRVTVDGVNLIAYCVDLFTDIGYATYNSTLTLPSDYPGGARAAWIFENYAAGVTTNIAGAALQLAVWDIIHDGGDGLSAGNVRLASSGSATLRSNASAIITASAGRTSNNATILRNVSVAGVPAQNLITSTIATPEPGTWLMTAVGLCFAGGLRRRRS